MIHDRALPFLRGPPHCLACVDKRVLQLVQLAHRRCIDIDAFAARQRACGFCEPGDRPRDAPAEADRARDADEQGDRRTAGHPGDRALHRRTDDLLGYPERYGPSRLPRPRIEMHDVETLFSASGADSFFGACRLRCQLGR